MLESDLVRSLLFIITRISSQLPERVPATPPELREESYALVGRLFAESEAQIYSILNAMIGASGNASQPYVVVPISPDQFGLYEALILSGQIPDEEIQEVFGANPDFAQWYKKRAKDRSYGSGQKR